MTKAILFYRNSLLTKLFMLVILLVGGGNFLSLSAQKALPYEYGFENNNLASEGWTINAGGTTGIYKGSSYSHESTYSFRFYGTTDTQYLFSPELANSATGIDVSFYYNSFTAYSSRTFNVGYSTTDTEVSSFTWLSSDITYTADGWRQFNESFPTGTKYIAIRHTAISQYQPFYLDDFSFSVSTAYKTPTSFALNSFTENSATFSWTAGNSETAWQFAYSTSSGFTPGTDGTTLDITDNPYTLTGLSENTTYYAYVRAYIDAVNQSDWVGPVSFTTLEQYPTPIDFALNGFTATTATFGWSNGEGTEATAWQIKYSTTKGFNPDETGTLVAANANPFTIEKLTESTTYYARLRADYGSSHYSSWNATEVEFTPSNDVNTLVNNGTDKSFYVPIAGSSVSSNENTMVKSQFIIPASSITAVRNRQITELTFYAENNSVSWGTATFEIYLREVDYTTFSTTSFESWGTKVFNSATLSVSDNAMHIALNTPFNYKDGNLQIGIKQTGTGSSSSTTWLSVRDGGYANLAIYGTGTGNTGTRTYYAPKVTITSVPTNTAPVQIGENGYTTFASRYSLDLTNVNLPSGLKAYKAAIDAENSKVRFTEINQTIPANTGVLLEGTAGQTYAIPVANSGTALYGNDFLVNSTGGTFTADYLYTYFGMKKATSASDALVFATFAPGSVAIPTDKAYLKVLTSSLPATSRQLVCSFDDETPTGISATQNDREKTINDEFIYNLNGQRVNKPSKGLYIVNGKKVIFK